MKVQTKVFLRLSLAAAIGGVALLWNGELPLNPQHGLTTAAHARVGRPLTPVSYAGVARRTTRRAVAVGVATAPVVVAPAPVVVTPACVQAVDAYGRIYTRCY
jgi:hypothetical protein